MDCTEGTDVDNRQSPARSAGDKQIVQHALAKVRTFVDEIKNGTRNFETVARLEEQVAAAYRGRCVLELLQNAHDALAVSSPEFARVTFVLKTSPDPVLLVANGGVPFQRTNFKGLCELGQSPKDPGHSVGNKGLGFRSVLQVASAPEIWSTESTAEGMTFAFRFDPAVRDEIAKAILELNESGPPAPSPFEPSTPLVDWSVEQFQRYLGQLSQEGMDGASEARQHLSPYRIPLRQERECPDVDELLSAGHVSVIRLPLDGGRGGCVEDAIASVKEQLTNLCDTPTTLFLPHLQTLAVDIDGERTVVTRTTESETALGAACGGHSQLVALTRSGLDAPKQVTDEFWVWTRSLGGASDPGGREKIRAAVQHLPNKWPNVEEAKIGVAVRKGAETAEGRFVVFLPTDVRTGTGAYVNAPFYGSLDRKQLDFEGYNTLLLEAAADLCLDAVDDLLQGEPAGDCSRAVVDILGAHGRGAASSQDMLALVRERAEARGEPIENRRLLLCDDGWQVAAKARSMPEIPSGVAVESADWRRAAAFSVVSCELDSRRFSVDELVNALDGRLAPTDSEWVSTVERMATLVRAGTVDANWNEFLTALLRVLPTHLTRPWGPTSALTSARFLPDQDERLIRASDDMRVFFQPVRGVDDAAELVETIPRSLKDRIAFIHKDVRTRGEGPQYQKTAVHSFLDEKFAIGFERDKIVRDVVIPARPSCPAAFGSSEADVCSDLFGWTMRLLGEAPSDSLLDLLAGLPLACYGGWLPASEAVFGPGWPGGAGDYLWQLADELPATTGDHLRNTTLLPPDDPRWGSDVGLRHDLFVRIGVAQGLRLARLAPIRFQASKASYDLPSRPPEEIDPEFWKGWRAVAVGDGEPRHQGWFNYDLERLRWLPGLQGDEALSRPGRRALSGVLLDAMSDWPAGWGYARVNKTDGEPSNWEVVSPLGHWLSTHPWLADGPAAPLPLSERWYVPTAQLRGNQDRFRHLHPLNLELSGRLESDPSLLEVLRWLGLNIYPDGERVGPSLLNALARSWRGHPELKGRFNMVLGQLRHAWQHFDENASLPNEYLVRNDRRSFEVVDSESPGSVYLPDHQEKGRTVLQSGKAVLEMPVREADRLADALTEATSIRRASALEERVMVDDVEWMGAKEGAPIEESRFHWLCVPLLAVAAHGGPDPTGPTTQRWTETLTMLRHARVVECESLVVELVVDDEPIAEHRPPAWWLAGDVLAVKREVGTKYEVLAPALESMLGRQNLHKDLLLVLGAVGGAHVPSTDTIQAALSRAEIDSSSLDDVRSYWVGSVGLIAARVRPVAELLGTAMDGFDDAAFDIDRLTDWLRESVPSWDAQQLVAAARRSRDDGAMGAEAWRALGGVAQLPEWNAVLDRLGSEYEPVINENLNEQVDDHVEALRPLLKAVARYAAIEAGNPSLFGKVDLLDLAMPSDWSTRWWHVPLSAVLAVVRRNCKDVGVGVEIRRLLDAGTIDGLREALVERGVEVDVDPYEVARTNREALAELTREVDDLYRAWLEFRTPGSKVPSPTAPEIDSEAFLHIWTPDDLWCRALEKVGDEQFKIACGAVRGPNEARKQLRLSEQEVEQRRAERVQSEKAARTRKATIAGRTYEAETIDYAELLKDHVTRLEEPVGPHAKYDEFTPLGTPPKRGNPGGAGPTTKRPRRKPSSTDPEIIGAIGELHAYRYLRKEFGGRAVQARAWVSETRLKAIPLVEGERHNTSDGHGFDFRFSHEGTKWCVEVKATPGDETSFELGISEIRAATGVARLAKPKLKWRILRVRQCLSEHPQFDWLPNPFEDGFRSHFQLREGGMMVSYVRDS